MSEPNDKKISTGNPLFRVLSGRFIFDNSSEPGSAYFQMKIAH